MQADPCPHSSWPPACVWLRPSPEVSEELAAHRAQWWWPAGCHLPEAHRLHLTLHELGPLSDDQLEHVLRALSTLRADAFDLELAWSGVWAHHPRAVAVACPRAHPALTDLHAALSRRLRGRAPVRGWSPHVTLAWDAPRAAAAPLPALRWPVREFLLVRSWMPPGARGRHEVLRRYALAAPPDTPCHAGGHTGAA